MLAIPASADHGSAENQSHWANGYRPKVTADCSQRFLGSIWLCEGTADAEGTWINNGVRNGFDVGHPWWGCQPNGGYIAVCWSTGRKWRPCAAQDVSDYPNEASF